MACSIARLATCSAAARSPTRYRASASRLASKTCCAEPAGKLATARPRTSAATWGSWRISWSAVWASQSSIHSSIGSVLPPDSLTTRSSCWATRSGGASASASAASARESPSRAARRYQVIASAVSPRSSSATASSQAASPIFFSAARRSSATAVSWSPRPSAATAWS